MALFECHGRPISTPSTRDTEALSSAAAHRKAALADLSFIFSLTILLQSSLRVVSDGSTPPSQAALDCAGLG